MPKLASLAAVAVAVLVLAGCTEETNPATNIDATSATLNATVTIGSTDQGGVYWFEWSRDAGSNWTQGPHHPWGSQSCTYNGSGTESNPVALHENVSGLVPSSHYLFRIAGTVCNIPVVYGDSNWRRSGDSDPPYEYDSFDTPASSASWTNGWGTYTSTGKVFPGANWRPFADTAAFNRKVPANPPISQSQQANADVLAQTMAAFSGDQGSKDGHVWFANSGDPNVRIDAPGNPPVDGTMVHIPRAAVADAQGDGHISIADSNTNYLTECWQATIDWTATPPVMHCSSADHTSISGDGLMQIYRVTAGGIAKLAGDVWPSEFAAGHIQHALALNVRCVHGHAYPAQNDNDPDPSDCTGGPWLGAHVWLDLTPQQISSISNPNARTLALALNEYGGYVRDSGNSGGWEFGSVSGESFTLEGAANPWSGFQAIQPGDIPLAGHLRILDPCTAKGTC